MLVAFLYQEAMYMFYKKIFGAKFFIKDLGSLHYFVEV